LRGGDAVLSFRGGEVGFVFRDRGSDRYKRREADRVDFVSGPLTRQRIPHYFVYGEFVDDRSRLHQWWAVLVARRAHVRVDIVECD
jgi:hypothetical protein